MPQEPQRPRYDLGKLKPFERAPDRAWDSQHTFPAPSAWIQWKGTTVCCDVHCSCGAHYHCDAKFFYNVRCPQCQKVFMVNGHIQLIELTPDEAQRAGATFAPEEEDVWAYTGPNEEEASSGTGE